MGFSFESEEESVSYFKLVVYLMLSTVALVAFHILLTIGTEKTIVQRRSLLSSRVDEVTGIKISRGDTDPIVLECERHWRMKKPYASSIEQRFVMRFLDALAGNEISASYGMRELMRLGRSYEDFGFVPGATEVELSMKGGAKTSKLVFGKLTPPGDGVYAKVDGENEVYIVSSAIIAAIDKKAEDFRRKSMFIIDGDIVKEITIKRARASFVRLVRAGDGWEMLEPKKAVAVSKTVDDMLFQILNASADSFVWPKGSSDETKSITVSLLSGYQLDDENAVTVTMKCLDGLNRQISFGSAPDSSSVYALGQNNTAIATVNSKLKELVDVDYSHFIDNRIFPVDFNSVIRVGLKYDDEEILLARNSEKGLWHFDAPIAAKCDDDVVLKMIGGLSRLDLSHKVSSGVKVSVGTDDGTYEAEVAKGDIFNGFELEGLRSKKLLDIEPSDVRRLVVSKHDSPRAQIIYDNVAGLWKSEISAQIRISQEAVKALLSELSDLEAVAVVKLYLSDGDVEGFGLLRPYMTISIDRNAENSVRKNLVIGAIAPTGGRYATIGASDSLFLLNDETLQRLSTSLTVDYDIIPDSDIKSGVEDQK